MKKFKLFLAAFVATLFAFVGGKAYADGYTITINNVSTGHTYEAYQVFSGTLAESDNQTLSDIDWGSDVNTFEFDGESDAAKIAEKLAKQATDSETAKAFAKAANANLKEGSKPASATSEGKTVTITLSKPGYYLVKDKDGSQNSENGTYTRFMMQVVGNATANVKNGVPSVQKKVKENSNSKWQDAADYDFDDDVPFQLTATLPSNFDDYSKYYLEFSDTLSAGLTFNKGVEVYVVNGETETEVTNYFYSNEANGQLTVAIQDLKQITVDGTATITKDSKIDVRYSATLNKNAIIGSKGNKNTVKLIYSNNPNNSGDGNQTPGTPPTPPTETGKTPEDTVIVFTYKVVVNKVDQDKKPLVGAEFTLSKKLADDSLQEVAVVKNTAGTTFTFSGLDDGDYVLSETTTPNGYNTIDDVEFRVTADHDVESASPALNSLSGDVTPGSLTFTSNITEDDASLTTDVVNKKGSVLPSTGSVGTTLLYLVGATLAIAAGVLLITKKRMDS